MNAWLDPLRNVLDGAPEPLTFFFRDDDAGWSDGRLYRLLDLFEEQRTPLDLAVIPQVLSEPLAHELLSRAQTAHLAVHQHGFKHVNHEPNGRKCEFGPSRSRLEQSNDLNMGQQRLERLLGRVVDPIFTPPWNRCTKVTVDCLSSLGFRVLSRDLSATPFVLDAISELPISVDWMRRRNSVAIGRQDLGRLIADAAQKSRPVGIMLHHASMDRGVLNGIRSLLDLLANHANAHCCLMREIVKRRTS